MVYSSNVNSKNKSLRIVSVNANDKVKKGKLALDVQKDDYAKEFIF